MGHQLPYLPLVLAEGLEGIHLQLDFLSGGVQVLEVDRGHGLVEVALERLLGEGAVDLGLRIDLHALIDEALAHVLSVALVHDRVVGPDRRPPLRSLRMSGRLVGQPVLVVCLHDVKALAVVLEDLEAAVISLLLVLQQYVVVLLGGVHVDLLDAVFLGIVEVVDAILREAVEGYGAHLLIGVEDGRLRLLALAVGPLGGTSVERMLGIRGALLQYHHARRIEGR